MKQIVLATENDKEEILKLYKAQLGRKFCPWNELYPTEALIEFDLSRDSLYVMKDENRNIIATVSIEEDDNVENLTCWNPALQPGGELARLAVKPDLQNKGIAREMMQHGMKVLADRGNKSIHFLVNKFNKKAIHSYSYFDFNVVGECEMYDQQFFCYEKKL